MDTIGKGPAILSTCVKRWRFFACKVGLLLQDRTKFGTAGLFRQTEHAKAVIRTVLYTLTTATNFNAAASKRKQNAGGTSLQKIVSKRERLTQTRLSQWDYGLSVLLCMEVAKHNRSRILAIA